MRASLCISLPPSRPSYPHWLPLARSHSRTPFLSLSLSSFPKSPLLSLFFFLPHARTHIHTHTAPPARLSASLFVGPPLRVIRPGPLPDPRPRLRLRRRRRRRRLLFPSRPSRRLRGSESLLPRPRRRRRRLRRSERFSGRRRKAGRRRGGTAAGFAGGEGEDGGGIAGAKGPSGRTAVAPPLARARARVHMRAGMRACARL